MKTLKYYLQKAYKEKWAIGQFNFSDFSQVKGIVSAAEHLRSPIILGTSEGESNFVGLEEAVAMRNVLRKKTGLPIFLNLDHGKSFEVVKKAITAGYDMVHFDGSKMPLAENIKISKKVTSFAHWRGIVVEGEVGAFATDSSKKYEGTFEIKEADLTSAVHAKEYAQKTKVNLLAVNVGTFHGIDSGVTSPSIRLDRLAEIKTHVNTPLVLHGGSGTPEADMKEAIRLGMVKVNINTDTRIAFANALRQTLETNKEEIVPYEYLPDAVGAVKMVAENKIKLFGSENKV